MGDVADATDMGILLACTYDTLALSSGFIANTFAMMWGSGCKDRIRPMAHRWRTSDEGRESYARRWKDMEWVDWRLSNSRIIVHATSCNVGTSFDEASVFVSPLTGSEDAWFSIGGPYLTAYIMGSFLGFACLLGDMTGSFFKRRRGLKREGDVSSKAPLLELTVCNHGVLMGAVVPWTIASCIVGTPPTHGDYHRDYTHFAPILQPHWLCDWMERRPVLNREGFMIGLLLGVSCALQRF